MITTSTSPFLYIDWGEDEPGMILQRWEGAWVDYKMDGKVVKSPVDIDALPPGRYRLVDDWKEKRLESKTALAYS
jgi:hypothetical protein